MEERYTAKQDCYIHRKIAGDDVLVSVGANVARFNGYIELNPAAATIWDALKEPKTAAELAEELMRVFEVDRETADRDAREYLAELLENNMVIRV